MVEFNPFAPNGARALDLRAKSPPRQTCRTPIVSTRWSTWSISRAIVRSSGCTTNGRAIRPTTPSRSASGAQLLVAEVARRVVQRAAERVADEHRAIARAREHLGERALGGMREIEGDRQRGHAIDELAADRG